MLISLVIVVLLAAAIGADLAAWRSRRRFIDSGETFRCRVRTCGDPSPAWPRLGRRWSRPMWATWAGDVLTVRRGPVFARTVSLRARVSAGVYTLATRDARRCGTHPVAVRVLTPDGCRLEIATDGEARLALVGPYLAAAVNDLPRAPIRRRQT
ncbi:hypothetical protein [Couchioplanes azureus]|uniref:hypothetical protein n=1 Tax=Couchioplanes caeruleus TaxID=56438 RepID=UPI0019A0D2DC|nr:hypothetical protein [Couchioplanes caeruleus]GGQ48893.1 hypothetical protein GCM10010166_16520 [Couchioplanes caeruleus subsp. azureus]